MRTRWRIWSALTAPLLALLLCAPVARAEDDEPDYPSEIPVKISAEVQGDDVASSGRWDVDLIFRVEGKVTRPYSVYVRITHRGATVLNYDHAPKPPTRSWRKGKDVRYTIPIPVPMERWIHSGDKLGVMVGFFDPEADKMVDSANEGVAGHFVHAASLVVPELLATDPPEIQKQVLDRAAALAAEGKKPDAWAVLETGIRRAVEDETKYVFRDALVKLGHFAPRPISLIEKQVVKSRIEREKRRYLRLMSGRYFGRGKLFAALRILEAIGGKLEEDSGEAVIGAVGEAERTTKDIQQIKLRITQITTEDQTVAREALNELGLTKACLDKAVKWFKGGEFGRAKYLLRELMTSGKTDLAIPAREQYDLVEAAWLAATPPEEQKLVDDAVNHPAFGRIGTVATHNFIYIGPKDMIEAIPMKGRLRFDLAYIFQTDLFGRAPNAGGDRITVFWKELWDFGGGQGGGKIIDIGRAKPDRKGYPVDTGLMYHELTHCIDDTSPILAGFREGLANMGAAYTFEAIGQKGDTLHAFARNLQAFHKDYLERDLEYWRIQSYQPSAGFFLHFVEKHSKKGSRHDWKPYRKFFREYRAAPIRDGREPYIARAFAYYLIRAFGEGAFDDLLTFRFPLVESDRKAIKMELEAFAKGDYALRNAGKELKDSAPNSPIPRDLIARRMIQAFQGRNHDEARRISQEELGVLHKWMVVGPFTGKGADPRAAVYPPEHVIDFTKEYPGGQNIAKWRQAADTGLVVLNSMGWVDLRYNYNDNTATYALSHVTVDKDMDAVVHLRCDDDFVLFINDRRIESYVNRGGAGSSQVWWRGPYERAPDAMRLAIKLNKGRNKVLLKVKNRHGPSGFILALAQENGRPIPGLTADCDPATSGTSTSAEPKKSAWKTVVKHRFTKKAFKSKLETTVGKFKVVNKALVGESTSKGVQWRKYTVRPGFPKDSPSNLFWLKDKYTKDVEEFRYTLELAPRNGGVPKLVVSFMGEGEKDGLSGWNLIVHGRGQNVAAQLERYDILAYQVAPMKHTKAEIQKLVLTYVGGRFTATLGETVLLDKVPIRPIKGPRRIGVSTYGPNLGIAAFKLEMIPQKK